MALPRPVADKSRGQKHLVFPDAEEWGRVFGLPDSRKSCDSDLLERIRSRETRYAEGDRGVSWSSGPNGR